MPLLTSTQPGTCLLPLLLSKHSLRPTLPDTTLGVRAGRHRQTPGVCSLEAPGRAVGSPGGKRPVMHSWVSKEEPRKRRVCSVKSSIIPEHFLMRIQHMLSLSLAFSFVATPDSGRHDRIQRTGLEGADPGQHPGAPSPSGECGPPQGLVFGSPTAAALANVDTFFVTLSLTGGGRAAQPRPGRLGGGHGQLVLVLTATRSGRSSASRDTWGTQQHTGHWPDLHGSPWCSRGGWRQAGGSPGPHSPAEAPSYCPVHWLLPCPPGQRGTG